MVTLAMAREKALANARAIAEGRDPRRRMQRVPTFAQVNETVVAIHAKHWKSERTEGQWRASMRDYVLPRLARVRDSGAMLAFEFLVLTAARSGEVRNARWEQIDRDGAVWTISAERMKTGREHRVPLSPRSLEVLDDAAELFDGAGLVVSVAVDSVVAIHRVRGACHMIVAPLVAEHGLADWWGGPGTWRSNRRRRPASGAGAGPSSGRAPRADPVACVVPAHDAQLASLLHQPAQMRHAVLHCTVGEALTAPFRHRRLNVPALQPLRPQTPVPSVTVKVTMEGVMLLSDDPRRRPVGGCWSVGGIPVRWPSRWTRASWRTGSAL